jgi:hypothetical protein
MVREPGFYWVKATGFGSWTIAAYTLWTEEPGTWFLLGTSKIFYDHNLEKIGACIVTQKMLETYPEDFLEELSDDEQELGEWSVG